MSFKTVAKNLVLAVVMGMLATSIAGADGSPNPTGDKIRATATDLRQYYDHMVKLAGSRQRLLEHNVTKWNIVTKVAQYVGGGGAVVFGLDEKGHNAAYSAAVGALATLIEQLGRTDSKSSEAGECSTLRHLGPFIISTTDFWIQSADDSAFQAKFPAQYSDFNTTVQTELQKNGCDIDLSRSWEEHAKVHFATNAHN